MMGDRTVMQEVLFYEFSIVRHVPADHLVDAIRWCRSIEPHGGYEDGEQLELLQALINAPW